MGTVDVFTKERMKQIEDETVVSGLVDENGDLILYTRAGDSIDAGPVIGPPGSPPPADETTPGILEVATNAEATAGTSDSKIITPLKLSVFSDARTTVAVVDPYWTVGDPKIKIGGVSVGTAKVGMMVGGVQPGDEVLVEKNAGQWRILSVQKSSSWRESFTKWVPVPGAKTYFAPWDPKSWGTVNSQSPTYDWSEPLWITKNSDGVVSFNGMVAVKNNMPAFTVFAYLPVEFRPPQIQIFMVTVSENIRALQIGTDGSMSFTTAVLQSNWITFGNVIYHSADQDLVWTPITTFLSGFTQRTVDRPVAIAMDRYGYVWLKGSVNLPGTAPGNDAGIFNLAAQYRPTYGRHLTCFSDGLSFVGVGPAGTYLQFKLGAVTAASAGTWLSLDGVVWRSPTATPQYQPVSSATYVEWGLTAFMSSWANYNSSSYTSLGFAKRPDGLVFYEGLVGAGSLNAPMTVVPPGHRPFKRIAFGAKSYNNVHARVSIDPLSLIASSTNSPTSYVFPEVGGTTWYSMDSVIYQAAM